MFFLKKLAAVVAVTILATSAVAGDLPSSGFTFGVAGSTFGDLSGQGTAQTRFKSGKTALNETSFMSDVVGSGCDVDCVTSTAHASTKLSEMGFIKSKTEHDESGALVGSSALMELGTTAGLQVGEHTLENQFALNAGGEVLAVGVGDHVQAVTTQDFTGKTAQELSFDGSPCGLLCGQTAEKGWIQAVTKQTADVTARGKEAFAISNATSSSLTGALQRMKAGGS